MNCESTIQSIQARISAAAIACGRSADEVTLCAATKVQSDATIRSAIADGIRVCGENRVQELVEHLAVDAYHGSEVHFIGHLQTNKVRQVVGQVALIHSVGSERLLRAIDTQAEKLGIRQDILLEINIANEPSKGGFLPEEALALAELATTLNHVRLRGLMAIPPRAEVRGGNNMFFSSMCQLFVDIKGKVSDNQSKINCLSMGMSDDFEDAIAHGSTLVRVGTALFGARPPITHL